MINYECEECKQLVEIEEYEATCGHHEHYQHGMCYGCFEKSLNNEI